VPFRWQMRALEHMGILSEIGGLSTVSGGSWVGSVYMFANRNKSELLGASTDPRELTMDVLEHMSQDSLGSVATHAMDPHSFLGIHRSAHTFWTRAVASIILEPFGLGDRFTFMAASPEHVEQIRTRNPAARKWQFLTPQKDRFKVFVMNGAILAPVGSDPSDSGTVAIQMSPDYIGLPYLPDVSYLDTTHSWEIYPLLGGGFVESFAFGGPEPKEGQGGSPHARMEPPKRAFSLADAIGISSAAFAGSALTAAMEEWAPQVDIWPVTTVKNDEVLARTYKLGDGGLVENGGVLAMLQRGVRSIIWLIDTDTRLDMETDFCLITTTDWVAKKKVTNQLYDKFGFFSSDEANEQTGYLDKNQIFAREDFAPLLCQLQQLVQRGEPTVYRAKLKLVENNWWNIPGGEQVDIIFVYNEPCSGFENLLPPDTRASLKQGDDGEFAHFPNYKTTFENSDFVALTRRQVNLAAAQSEYFVRKNEAMFKSFLADSSNSLLT